MPSRRSSSSPPPVAQNRVQPRPQQLSPAAKARRRARTRRRQAIVLAGVLLLGAIGAGGWALKKRISKVPLAVLPRSIDPRIAAAEKIATVRNCDVAVLGATPSGVAAALSAARAGAKVVLVEPRPLLGGDLTYAWINQFDVPIKALHSDHSPVDYGIFGEFYNELGVAFNPATARALIETKLSAETNIQILRATTIEHLSLDDGRLRTVLLHSGEDDDGKNEGWIRLVASAWVDASNDGDTAAKAGSGFFLGREQSNPDRAMQAAGLFFKLKNVNWDKIRLYTRKRRSLPLHEALEKKPTILTSTDSRLRGDKVIINLGGGIGPYAWERGDIVKGYVPHINDVDVMSINFGRTAKNEVILNTLNVLGVNGLTRYSRLHGRKQALRELPYLIPFLRQRMPGLEHAELAGVAPELYIRETRHISGITKLTAENVKNATLFPDRIALCAYSMDLHPYKKGEPLSGSRRWVFTLPLSALIPLRVDGLFVASRSLSATWMAAGAARVIPVTMAAGQAAGLCAAMCAQQNISPHQFIADTGKVSELQDSLRQAGVDVGDDAQKLAAQSKPNAE